MQDTEKMSPDEIRMIRDSVSFVARRHNGEYEIWHQKGMSLLKKAGWQNGDEEPSLIYVIGIGEKEKYVFVSENHGRSVTYVIASKEGGLQMGIATWHEVLAGIGVR